MDFLGGFEDFLVAAGTQQGSFIKKVLSGAGDFACQLHYNTPGVIFDLNPFNRALWQELCAPRPSGLPPAPQLPFTGGQCEGVEYRVRLTVTTIYNTTPVYERTVWGAIGGARTNGDRVECLCRGNVSAGESLAPSPFWTLIGTSGGAESVVLEVLYRLDGQPDNCGNLPDPGSQPVVLPPEQRTTNINVTNIDGSVVSVATVLNFPSGDVDFNLSVPLVINAGGFNFHVNLDGFHFGLPGAGDISIVAGDVQEISSDVVEIQQSLVGVTGSLNQYFSPPNPSVDGTLVLISPSADKPSDEQKDVPNAAWLIIDLTKLPDKAQYGGDSPTVYFAGWLEFLKEGRAFPRQQINFEQSIFRFPDGADGYAYTFTNGAQGNVSVYVEENQ